MRDCVETMATTGSRLGFTPEDRANLAIGKDDRGPKQEPGGSWDKADKIRYRQPPTGWGGFDPQEGES